jgi:hypothetical protein
MLRMFIRQPGDVAVLKLTRDRYSGSRRITDKRHAAADQRKRDEATEKAAAALEESDTGAS